MTVSMGHDRGRLPQLRAYFEYLLVVMAVFALTIAPTACSAGSKGDPLPIPKAFQQGEGKFKANCARCHGDRAVGTNQGPPLVHKIYEPSHHGDAAFQMAASRGVRAHHWNFGDMPQIAGVTPEDVTEITAYIRWLQRQAGIQ